MADRLERYRGKRTQGGTPELGVGGTSGGKDARRNPQSTQPESVRTGRTVEQVAEDESG